MSKERFTKARFLAEIERRAQALQVQFHFDPTNGWAQVDGKGTEIAYHFGVYDAYTQLLEEFCD